MKFAFVLLASISVTLAAEEPGVSAKALESSPPKPAPVQKKLPYGVEDVLKLSQAQVNDDIIVKFIQNTGTIYNLGPDTIIQLKEAGVSDTVINAMLDQPKRLAGGTTSTWTSQTVVQPQQPQVAPAYTQPPQPDPVPAPPPRSTLHIIPYYQATFAYPYYGSGYYNSYFCGPRWYGPCISFGLGFGFGGYHHGHYRYR